MCRADRLKFMKFVVEKKGIVEEAELVQSTTCLQELFKNFSECLRKAPAMPESTTTATFEEEAPAEPEKKDSGMGDMMAALGEMMQMATEEMANAAQAENSSGNQQRP